MKRVYLFIFTITLIAAGILAFIIWKLPPQDESDELIVSNLVFFAISFTIFITCFIGFILHFFHRLLIPGGDIRDVFRQSLRQGLFITLIIDGLLLFQKLAVFTILNIVLLVLIFVTLEGYLLIRNNMSKTEKEKVEIKPSKTKVKMKD